MHLVKPFQIIGQLSKVRCKLIKLDTLPANRRMSQRSGANYEPLSLVSSECAAWGPGVGGGIAKRKYSRFSPRSQASKSRHSIKFLTNGFSSKAKCSEKMKLSWWTALKPRRVNWPSRLTRGLYYKTLQITEKEIFTDHFSP